jgi:apolipoprotein D and lipocalin family protein
MRKLAMMAALLLAACVPDYPSTRYATAPFYLQPVDAGVLAGTWYEIARFPGPFAQGCSHTTANYTAPVDGVVGVTNRCRVDGQTVQITGTAVPAGPGQFKVRLEGVPFRGDYWVLGVADRGQTLLVGTPSRRTGWVLHRDRRMTPQQIDHAEAVFRRNGYDIAALQRTDQR